MRALRDELRRRLDQNEDYRARKALDQTLRELEPPSLPQAVEFALSAMRAPSGNAEVGPSHPGLTPRRSQVASLGGLFLFLHSGLGAQDGGL